MILKHRRMILGARGPGNETITGICPIVLCCKPPSSLGTEPNPTCKAANQANSVRPPRYSALGHTSYRVQSSRQRSDSNPRMRYLLISVSATVSGLESNACLWVVQILPCRRYKHEEENVCVGLWRVHREYNPTGVCPPGLIK